MEDAKRGTYRSHKAVRPRPQARRRPSSAPHGGPTTQFSPSSVNVDSCPNFDAVPVTPAMYL